MKQSIFIGFDKREAAAFAVAKHSTVRRLTAPIPVRGIVLDEIHQAGLYWRPTERRDGRLWDLISDAPCATEFSISRFLTVHLALQRANGVSAPAWALFMDCDMLVRANLCRLFDQFDPRFAVMCVKHPPILDQGEKMVGQLQVPYDRKNWSSFVAYNLRHPANRALTLDLINTAPGRDLHRFCWLKDDEIGELDPTWNWFAHRGCEGNAEPAVVHFTRGTPDMPGHHDQPFASEWWGELACWAS